MPWKTASEHTEKTRQACTRHQRTTHEQRLQRTRIKAVRVRRNEQMLQRVLVLVTEYFRQQGSAASGD